VWGGGWLAQLGKLAHIGHGVVDYAGSSVVHLQGGAIALILAWMLGPRIGKYKDGKPQPILPHHIPMVMLGTFILAFGWFGFNAGSSLAATDGRIGIVAVNTMLAGAFGAFTSCLYMWVVHEAKKPDPSMMCNGALAGLVAITSPCAFVAPWAACVIGGLSGVFVVWAVFFWEKRGIDDPVGAISVHGVNGAWGVLSVGIFADGTYGAGWNGVEGTVRGLLYGAGGGSQFLAQLIGVCVCVTWNMLAAGIIFWAIGKVTGGNRVPAEVEISGLDIPEMGLPGYPEWGPAAAVPEQFPVHTPDKAPAYKPSGVIATSSAGA
jgi:Amt family ammonium transporter